MRKLTKKEITELVEKIADEAFDKEAAHMPEELEELIKEKQNYESLLVGLNAFVIGFNHRVCRNMMIQVVYNIMDGQNAES